MAVVIHLPVPEVRPKLCIDCANGALSRYGVYCLAYQEMVDDEKYAEECELWEE